MSDDGFPKSPEKRHYQRIDLELPVVLEYNGTEIKSTTHNISCGGMFLPNGEHQFKQDEPVVAFLSLPDAAKTVKLNGRVCRIVGEATSTDPSGVAIEFNGLYDENQFAVDRFVKKNLLN